jgi:hypothetical protein
MCKNNKHILFNYTELRLLEMNAEMGREGSGRPTGYELK